MKFPLKPLHRLTRWRYTLWQLRLYLRYGPRAFQIAEDSISKYQAYQRQWELFWLLGIVRSCSPRVVLEIGSFQGGTIYAWACAAHPDATIISLDLPRDPAEESSLIERFRGHLKTGQRLARIAGDSHSPDTRKRVVDALAGSPVDFLFIDGDHSYEGVKSDFAMYASLVRPGGIIGFHDIQTHDPRLACQVSQFWSEIKKEYPHLELVDRDGNETWGGIGVLTK